MPSSTQSDWARVLQTSLADAGVHDVVVSPGSRSTPFVLAALRLAAAGRLRCHDVADERSAAFFALGRARVTGRPALLLCTSGSAVAHYLPAVVEADADRLPLLILSADRPVELQHCGANQTLDQLHLFGRHVRRFVDLGAADSEGSRDRLRALRRSAAQAVFDATWPIAGAVHLNVRARKPLEPPTGVAADPHIEQMLARPIAVPVAPRAMPPRREIDLFLARAAGARSGLVVAGPAHLDQGAVRDRLKLIAARLRWPIVADATSQLRDGDSVHGGAALLETSFGERFAPEMVLQWGSPPAASAWGRRIRQWCAGEPATDHWVFAADAWRDPESTASHLVFGDPDACLDRLLDRLELATELPHPSAQDAQEAWRRGSDLARRIAHQLSHESAGEPASPTEAEALRRVIGALPPDVQLVLGNSLPVREADLWAMGEEFDGRAVLHQRGLSGIDGGVAGAVGAAVGGTSSEGRATLLLLGDVSLRHDLGSLELARLAPGLVIVVIDNGGGRIFEHLPLARHPETTPELFRHWLQPAATDFAGVAAGHGLAYRRPSTGPAVTAAIHEAFAPGHRESAWLIDVKVAPSSAVEAARELVRRLQAALEDEGLA